MSKIVGVGSSPGPIYVTWAVVLGLTAAIFWATLQPVRAR